MGIVCLLVVLKSFGIGFVRIFKQNTTDLKLRYSATSIRSLFQKWSVYPKTMKKMQREEISDAPYLLGSGYWVVVAVEGCHWQHM